MAEKMGEAIGVVEVYEEYQKLKEKYCSPDLKIQVMLNKANTGEIKVGIGNASDTVRKWIQLLNTYYDYNPTRE